MKIGRGACERRQHTKVCLAAAGCVAVGTGAGAALPCFISCRRKVSSLDSAGTEFALFVNLKWVLGIYFRKRQQKESHT